MTSSYPDEHTNHYTIQIQVPEQLKISLLKCLYENPPLQLGDVSAICAFLCKLQLVDHLPSRIVSILRTISCSEIYPLVRPPRRSLVLGRGRILISSYVSCLRRCPFFLARRDFPCTEDETRRNFPISLWYFYQEIGIYVIFIGVRLGQ